METFSALLAICAGNSPVPGEFPAQRPVTRSFDVFFDLRLNRRLSRQSWGWWFGTLSSPLWGHCNVTFLFSKQVVVNKPKINASEVLTILVYFRYAPTSPVTSHERSRVLFHRPFDCLFKGSSTPTKKAQSNLYVTHTCAGKPPVTSEMSSQQWRIGLLMAMTGYVPDWVHL